MSPEDHRRALLDLAQQLRAGEDLAEGQKQYLSDVFQRIAMGEDANNVLSLKRGRGQKRADVIDKQRMSLILHWVSCAMHPDPDTDTTKKAMTLSEACVEAVGAIVPFAKKVFPGGDQHQYDAEYIERCWSDRRYAHMRSPERGWFDPDYPYHQFLEVKDPK
jgi:hypothetical protein